MYIPKIRFLFALLCLILLCSAVQATNLQITVQDSLYNTTIPNAIVYLNGANVGMTNNQGVFLLTSGQGTLDIRVSSDGYYDWENTSVDSSLTSLLVLLNRQSHVLKVDLLDSNTLQPVTGATLLLTSNNYTVTKQTDATGSASFWVTAYSYYALNISAQNYQSRSETIGIAAADQEQQYLLLSLNQYSFVVEDKDTMLPISSAIVQINGVLVGKTDSRGILITPVTRGTTVTVAVSADGYQAVSESETIGANQALETVYLTRIPLSAIIFVSGEDNNPVSGASISINNASVASTNQFGRATLTNLAAGSYVVSAVKSGYQTTTRQIDIINQSSEFDVVLPFGQAGLTILVNDTDRKNVPNATIILNGITLGMTDANGQFITPITYNTSYNITSTKDGYLPGSLQEQFLANNPNPTVTLTLEKSPDWGLITTIAIGVIAVILLLAIIRMFGRRRRRHTIKRDEI
jgi:hypothetical protein